MSTALKVITQLTSKTTAVDLGRLANARIQTVALTDLLDTSFNFSVTCDRLSDISNIQLTPQYSGTGIPSLMVVSRSDTGFVVKVANVGVASFNATLGINVTIVG